MKINQFGQIEASQSEVISALYANKITSLSDIFLNNKELIEQFNSACLHNGDKFSPLLPLIQPITTVEEFDRANQQMWFMPDEYKHFDIVNWLYDRCTTDKERDRISIELELYVQHGMYELLIYLKYLVDTMRKHEIVWGVGRGSSVSSYVLFLIGIHKVNSILYELDIKEFFK